jgi:hypothetical protein
MPTDPKKKRPVKPAIEDGADRVAAVVDTATPWRPTQLPDDPRAGDTQRWGYAAGWWREEPHIDRGTGLPANIPLTPLGVDADVYWFIDAIDQVRCLRVRDFSRNMMVSLFGGRVSYLMHHWPRIKGEGDKAYIDTFKPEKVTDDLIAACSAKGAWNDVESVRGRGAWRRFDGGLIVHCGDRLISSTDGKAGTLPLGEIDGFVYPARPALPGALNSPLTGRPGPARTLLPMLRRWEFRRPELDPLMTLGWLGAAQFSGALEWRPAIYAVGDKETGKSHLQRLIKYTLGGWLVQSNDATAAGIYQRVRHDAVAVAIDELEGEKDANKQKAIIKLMRVSSSGGLMLRGGADHNGAEFQARSSFLFSSINTPPLEPQDLSRMALLELMPLKKNAEPMALIERELLMLGRQVMQRMLDNWHLWDAKHEAWRRMLARAGHKGRGQDTFGTLMTCAELIIDQDASELGVTFSETLDEWLPHFDTNTMTEMEGDIPNWRLCLNRILSTPVEAWRGGLRTTVGGMLVAYNNDEEDSDGHKISLDRVNRELAAAGLKLHQPKRGSAVGGGTQLFVPNRSPSLQRLFWGSKWYGEQDAGVWPGALRQAPEDWVTPSQQVWLSGVNERGCLIPLAKILEGLERGGLPMREAQSWLGPQVPGEPVGPRGPDDMETPF